MWLLLIFLLYMVSIVDLTECFTHGELQRGSCVIAQACIALDPCCSSVKIASCMNLVGAFSLFPHFSCVGVSDGYITAEQGKKNTQQG